MSNASRKGDISTGHGCYPPRPSNNGSGNVLINGIGAHRLGDSYVQHCCVHCHGGRLINGSGTVLINGKSAGRVGDSISCGESVMTGSSNVFIGG